MNTHDTIVPLASVLNEALSSLDNFAELLAVGGHEDVAGVYVSLLRDTRAQLQSVVDCLESGCGRQLILRRLGGVLCPLPCTCMKQQACRASGTTPTST